MHDLLKHLLNVEPHSLSQAFLRLDFECRDAVSELKLDVLGLRRAVCHQKEAAGGQSCEQHPPSVPACMVDCHLNRCIVVWSVFRGRVIMYLTGHIWGVLCVASSHPSSSCPISRTKGMTTQHDGIRMIVVNMYGLSCPLRQLQCKSRWDSCR